MSKSSTCVHCGIEFDPILKRQRAKLENLPLGRINECLECVDSDEIRKTGVMIYTAEGCGQVQINADPCLTKMLNTRRWETSGIKNVDSGNRALRVVNPRRGLK